MPSNGEIDATGERGGHAASHPEVEPLPDVRFGFGSSFVLPAVRKEFDDLSALLKKSATADGPVHQQVDNLADLFARSPFQQLEMEFDRDQDTGRDISLRRDFARNTLSRK